MHANNRDQRGPPPPRFPYTGPPRTEEERRRANMERERGDMGRGDRNEMGRHGNIRGERLPDRMDGRRGGHDIRREQQRHDDRHRRR